MLPILLHPDTFPLSPRQGLVGPSPCSHRSMLWSLEKLLLLLYTLTAVSRPRGHPVVHSSTSHLLFVVGLKWMLGLCLMSLTPLRLPSPPSLSMLMMIAVVVIKQGVKVMEWCFWSDSVSETCPFRETPVHSLDHCLSIKDGGGAVIHTDVMSQCVQCRWEEETFVVGVFVCFLQSRSDDTLCLFLKVSVCVQT